MTQLLIANPQIENLKRAAGGYMPHNIKFFTYAKLVTIREVEVRDIRVDYIILNEFHR